MYTKSELQRLYAKAKAARLFGGVAALITGVASTLLTMDGRTFCRDRTRSLCIVEK